MSAHPVCDDTRYDSQPLATCPICRTEFRPDGRGRFCTPRCRQTAYRLRHRQVNTAHSLTSPNVCGANTG